MVSAPGPTYSFNGGLVQGCNIADSPLGFTQIANLYQQYVVLGYKFSITGIPSTVTDTFRMVVLPLGVEQIPSSGAASVDLRVMESQPRAKAVTCSSGVAASGGGQKIVVTGKPHIDLGMKEVDYESEVWPITGGPARSQFTDYMGVFVQQLNGATNTQALMFSIEVSQIVKFSDLTQFIN